MQVLIVEDERNVASLVRNTLEAEGFSCFVAYDGETGLQLFKERKPDLVLLDLGLPRMNGLDVCTHIRQSKVEKDPFVVMLTAKGTETDRIIGFSTGADDYIPKPFSPQELVVRLRALFRRTMRHQLPAQKVIETPNFVIDPEKREVLVQKTYEGEVELVTLSPVEFDLLSLMANRPGRVWTRVELLDTVKGFDFIGEERTIDTYIKRLRKKISPGNDRGRFIRTHIGVGYSFEDRAG
jgi:DNA-binding response OmpR family regulator